jgi:hypothetical protein
LRAATGSLSRAALGIARPAGAVRSEQLEIERSAAKEHFFEVVFGVGQLDALRASYEPSLTAEPVISPPLTDPNARQILGSIELP